MYRNVSLLNEPCSAQRDKKDGGSERADAQVEAPSGSFRRIASIAQQPSSVGSKGEGKGAKGEGSAKLKSALSMKSAAAKVVVAPCTGSTRTIVACRVVAGSLQGRCRVVAGCRRHVAGCCRHVAGCRRHVAGSLQVGSGWLQVRCRHVAGWFRVVQGGCRVVVGTLQGGCRVVVGTLQGRCRVVAGSLQGVVHVGWLQSVVCTLQGRCSCRVIDIGMAKRNPSSSLRYGLQGHAARAMCGALCPVA